MPRWVALYWLSHALGILALAPPLLANLTPWLVRHQFALPAVDETVEWILRCAAPGLVVKAPAPAAPASTMIDLTAFAMIEAIPLAASPPATPSRAEAPAATLQR